MENTSRFFDVERCFKSATAREENDLSAHTLIYDALSKHRIQQINSWLRGVSSRFTVLAALKQNRHLILVCAPVWAK